MNDYVRKLLGRAAGESSDDSYRFSEATLLIEVGSSVMSVEKICLVKLSEDLIEAETERGDRYILPSGRLVGVKVNKESSGGGSARAGFAR